MQPKWPSRASVSLFKNLKKPRVFTGFWLHAPPEKASIGPRRLQRNPQEPILGHLAAFLSHLWGHLGPSWVPLGPSWSHLGEQLETPASRHPRCHWGALKLGQLTAVLKQNVVILGAFWGHFLVIFGVIFWTTFWPLFGPLLGAISGLMALVWFLLLALVWFLLLALVWLLLPGGLAL